MGILLIVLALLIFYKRKFNSHQLSPSHFIVLCYIGLLVLSFVFTVFLKMETPEYHFFSLIYFLLCLFALFIPLVKHHGRCADFRVDDRFMVFISYIIVFGGLINIYYNLSNHSIAEIAMDFGAARAEYYANTDGTGIATKLVDRIAINLFPLMAFALPLSLYNLVNKRKCMAVLLFIASLSYITNSLVIASRQELFLWVGSAVIAFLMYKDYLPSKATKIITLLFSSIIIVVGIVIGIITFSRFSDRAFESLFGYAGVQPFNSAYFLENLSSQCRWGQVNFSTYLGRPYIYQLNEVFNSAEYLNVFGTVVGSLYLDFGYFTVVFAFLFANVINKILSYFASIGSFLYYYTYVLYANFMFAGIFYNRYQTPSMMKPLLAVGVCLLLYEIFLRRKKNYINSPRTNQITN